MASLCNKLSNDVITRIIVTLSIVIKHTLIINYRNMRVKETSMRRDMVLVKRFFQTVTSTRASMRMANVMAMALTCKLFCDCLHVY